MTRDATSPDSKTERTYWDKVWKRRHPHRPVFSTAGWRNDLVIKRFDRFVARKGYFHGRERARLLELGCAGSHWLPYFSHRWHFRVEGLDYSEEGCQLARDILRHEGVDGAIHLADIFDPPEELRNRFDVVCSSGVLEHFEDQVRCLDAFRSFLTPSGLLITMIPNMCGLMGTITRALTPEVYERHVPISRERLREAHETCGLVVEHCDYFLPFSLGVINFDFIRSSLPHYVVSNGCVLISRAICSLLDGTPLDTTSRWLSPYVLSVAGTPAS